MTRGKRTRQIMEEEREVTYARVVRTNLPERQIRSLHMFLVTALNQYVGAADVTLDAQTVPAVLRMMADEIDRVGSRLMREGLSPPADGGVATDEPVAGPDDDQRYWKPTFGVPASFDPSFFRFHDAPGVSAWYAAVGEVVSALTEAAAADARKIDPGVRSLQKSAECRFTEEHSGRDWLVRAALTFTCPDAYRDLPDEVTVVVSQV